MKSRAPCPKWKKDAKNEIEGDATGWCTHDGCVNWCNCNGDETSCERDGKGLKIRSLVEMEIIVCDLDNKYCHVGCVHLDVVMDSKGTGCSLFNASGIMGDEYAERCDKCNEVFGDGNKKAGVSDEE